MTANLTRWKLTIEYDGSFYHGWQRQPNVKSVQEEIEKAIYGFSNQSVTLHAAGRTDAGVHAHGQVAHVDLAPLAKEMDGYEIAKAINAYLRSQPISVYHAVRVDSDFHARFGAQNKLYAYRIIQRPGFLALDRKKAWHFKRPLAVDAMQEAAQHLVGHHDFTTFRDTGCQAKSPERTVNRLEFFVRAYDLHGGLDIVMEAEAQSFLHHQVRNMIGTLTLVGEGKWTPDDVKTALNAKDRTKGGPTAPADGLSLIRIDY